jgi:hypothetical protein
MLAAVGVAGGAVLRSRPLWALGAALLLLGTTVLLWQAAADWGATWLGWAAGLVLGAAALALFAQAPSRGGAALRPTGAGAVGA